MEKILNIIMTMVTVVLCVLFIIGLYFGMYPAMILSIPSIIIGVVILILKNKLLDKDML